MTGRTGAARGGPLLVGVDAGTTNTKVLILEPEGHIVAAASEPTPVAYPRPEWAEYDPEALWGSCARAIRAAVAQIEEPQRIAGIAIASMGETAIPLDGGGRPAATTIAWFDKRARAELALIVRRIGAERLFAITGLAPEPIFGLCKLLWLRAHEAEHHARIAHWLNTADYLAWRLCGEMATDHSLASRTFALDIGALAWSEEVLGALAIAPTLMASLVASGHALGRVTAEAAAATGLPAGCVVAAGGHDHVVGALAADALRPGIHLHSTGTTEALLAAGSGPSRNPELGRAGFSQGVITVDEPVWFVVGGLFTAGAAIDWFLRNVGAGAEYGTLIAEAEAAPPGSLGAGFLPQLRLGTPPHPDAHARGAFFGLSTDTDRGCLFRAVLEGIAADMRLMSDALLELSSASAPEEVRVIGGLTRNRLYMRIKAAVLGRPLTILDLPDSVAVGAALLAGIGSGVYRSGAEAHAKLRREQRKETANPAEAAFYADLVRRVYARAYPALSPLHAAIGGATQAS